MLKKLIAILISLLLIFEQTGFAQVAPQSFVPNYLQGMLPVDHFRPMHMRYFSFDSSADTFEVLLDRGDVQSSDPKEIENTSRKVLEYFQIGLVLPNSSFWVNLRPDSPNDIIDHLLAKTDLGKVMLEADLQLKKDLARFTSPDLPEGKRYWDGMYAKAEELFGSNDDMSIPTLSRPWIVPGEVIVAETASGAYIYKATLKVMLEEDYLKDSVQFSFDDQRLKTLNDHSVDLIKQLIIPKLTREVNSSKRYSQLRQVYYSLIMAQYFKSKLSGQTAKLGAGQDSLISRIDSKNLSGLMSRETWSPDAYFKAYQQSFQQGEYKKQESVYTPFGMTIRTYCTGGVNVEPLSSGAVVIRTATDTFGRILNKEIFLRVGGRIRNAVIEPESASPGLEDLSDDSAFRDGGRGAMKQIGRGPEMDEDAARDLKGRHNAFRGESNRQWKTQDVELGDGTTTKAKVIRVDLGSDGDAGPGAYHFWTENGQLIIVLNSRYSEDVLDEGAFHEAREAYWETKKDESGDFIYTREQVHILAAAEQVIKYGKDGQPTPYHQQQLEDMAEKEDWQGLVDIILEGESFRKEHHELLKRAGFSEDDIQQVKTYESNLRKQAAVVLLEGMKSMFVTRPDLRNKWGDILSPIIKSPGVSSYTRLAALLLYLSKSGSFNDLMGENQNRDTFMSRFVPAAMSVINGALGMSPEEVQEMYREDNSEQGNEMLRIYIMAVVLSLFKVVDLWGEETTLNQIIQGRESFLGLGDFPGVIDAYLEHGWANANSHLKIGTGFGNEHSAMIVLLFVLAHEMEHRVLSANNFLTFVGSKSRYVHEMLCDFAAWSLAFRQGPMNFDLFQEEFNYFFHSKQEYGNEEHISARKQMQVFIDVLLAHDKAGSFNPVTMLNIGHEILKEMQARSIVFEEKSTAWFFRLMLKKYYFGELDESDWQWHSENEFLSSEEIEAIVSDQVRIKRSSSAEVLDENGATTGEKIPSYPLKVIAEDLGQNNKSEDAKLSHLQPQAFNKRLEELEEEGLLNREIIGKLRKLGRLPVIFTFPAYRFRGRTPSLVDAEKNEIVISEEDFADSAALLNVLLCYLIEKGEATAEVVGTSRAANSRTIVIDSQGQERMAGNEIIKGPLILVDLGFGGRQYMRSLSQAEVNYLKNHPSNRNKVAVLLKQYSYFGTRSLRNKPETNVVSTFEKSLAASESSSNSRDGGIEEAAISMGKAYDIYKGQEGFLGSVILDRDGKIVQYLLQDGRWDSMANGKGFFQQLGRDSYDADKLLLTEMEKKEVSSYGEFVVYALSEEGKPLTVQKKFSFGRPAVAKLFDDETSNVRDRGSEGDAFADKSGGQLKMIGIGKRNLINEKTLDSRRSDFERQARYGKFISYPQLGIETVVIYDRLPTKAFAYHFEAESEEFKGKNVIVISEEYEGTPMAEEALYHEVREIYWMRNGFTKYEAHTIAALEQSFEFSIDGTIITPLHAKMLDGLYHGDIIKLMTEDRAWQRKVIGRAYDKGALVDTAWAELYEGYMREAMMKMYLLSGASLETATNAGLGSQMKIIAETLGLGKLINTIDNKKALLVYPVADHNGAFKPSNRNEIEWFKSYNFDVRTAEVASLGELLQFVYEETADGKADVLVIAGHANQQAMLLGSGLRNSRKQPFIDAYLPILSRSLYWNKLGYRVVDEAGITAEIRAGISLNEVNELYKEDGYINLHNAGALAILNEYLNFDATIYLRGCSTAAGNGNNENIAQAIANKLPFVNILAADSDVLSGTSRPEFDKTNGRLTGFTFRTDSGMKSAIEMVFGLPSGQMKEIGPYDPMDEDNHVSFDIRHDGFIEQAKKPVGTEDYWLKDETKIKAKVISDDLGTDTEEGPAGYHFWTGGESEKGDLIIVVNSRHNDKPEIQQEARFHEVREAYWISEGYAPWQAHILAWAEQNSEFRQDNGVTPFQEYMIGRMDIDQLEELRVEYDNRQVARKTQTELIINAELFGFEEENQEAFNRLVEERLELLYSKDENAGRQRKTIIPNGSWTASPAGKVIKYLLYNQPAVIERWMKQLGLGELDQPNIKRISIERSGSGAIKAVYRVVFDYGERQSQFALKFKDDDSLECGEDLLFHPGELDMRHKIKDTYVPKIGDILYLKKQGASGVILESLDQEEVKGYSPEEIKEDVAVVVAEEYIDGKQQDMADAYPAIITASLDVLKILNQDAINGSKAWLASKLQGPSDIREGNAIVNGSRVVLVDLGPKVEYEGIAGYLAPLLLVLRQNDQVVVSAANDIKNIFGLDAAEVLTATKAQMEKIKMTEEDQRPWETQSLWDEEIDEAIQMIDHYLDGGKTQQKTGSSAPGGIDFRALPFNVQPQAVLSCPVAAIAALKQLAQQSQMKDLDREWDQIQKQCCNEVVPYNRIKEYVAVCSSRANSQKRLGAVAGALEQILRFEEDCAVATNAQLTELLVLLNSLETV